jgi:hypothetical protein
MQCSECRKPNAEYQCKDCGEYYCLECAENACGHCDCICSTNIYPVEKKKRRKKNG